MSLTKASYAMINGSPVNVLDYGADPTGVADSTAAIQAALDASTSVFIPVGTYKTTASLYIRTSGQVLIGASSGDMRTVLGAGGAVIKPTSAVSQAIIIAKALDYVTGFEIKSLSIDMDDMTDAGTSIGIYQDRSYHGLIETVAVFNAGTSKIAHKAVAGAYVTTLLNCQYPNLHLIGTSLIDAVTTFTIVGCTFNQVYMRYVATCTFLQAVIQGTQDKFDLEYVDGLAIYGSDIEGTGVYLKIGANCLNIFSMGNFFVGFGGTYKTGSIAGGRSQLLDNGATFEIDYQNLVLNSGTITAKSSDAVGYRQLIESTNVTAQQVDIHLKNSFGQQYTGITPTGDSFIDNRGSGKNVLQVSGADKLGVAANKVVVNTSVSGTAGALVGYIVITIGSTDYKVPYYAVA